MKKIYKSIEELIGNTPIIELQKFEKKYKLKANLLAKLEYFNPAGSIKDRPALNMIKMAEDAGLINSDTVIIEPTSGNMGIGICSVAASRGYKTIIVMPETMSIERRKLMSAYGADLVLTDGSKGMKGSIEKANELAKDIPNSFMPSQFTNPDNPKSHYLTTGPEIWNDTEGNIDYLISGIGTGGTISGVGRYLKEKNPNIKIIAIEPDTSAVLSGESSGSHKIQGIGAGFIPEALDTKIYDEIIKISGKSAYDRARELAKCEGILAGISSGAAIQGAIDVALRNEAKGKNVLAILPDTGERYLSTELFNL